MKISIPVLLVTLVLLMSCHANKTVATNVTDPEVNSEVLSQYRWELEELNGKPVSSQGKTAFLRFLPGQVSKVSGNTGCNHFSGSIERVDKNGIRFSPLAVTKMACPGENTEPAFLEMLQQANNWSLVNNKLALYHDKTLIAKFKAVTTGLSN